MGGHRFMSVENLSSIEIQLYRRQLILPEWGAKAQNAVKESHVAVIGAGGLGSPALLYLAAAGVGTITVIDDDTVEVSNLHRQIIHTFASTGNSKAESAALAMRSLNPTVRINVLKERLTEDNAVASLSGADAVLDGSDNFDTRYITSAACSTLNIPHVWGAILGFDAQMSVFWSGRGPVYEDLYPQAPAPGSVPNCATAGVLGALAGVVGTSMALETLKVLTGVGTPLMGEVGYYSGLEGRWEYIPLHAQSEKTPAVEIAYSTVEEESSNQSESPLEKDVTKIHNSKSGGELTGENSVAEVDFEQVQQALAEGSMYLLDVRESHEHEAVSIPGSHHWALSEIRSKSEAGQLKGDISGRIGDTSMPVLVYCAGGVRSMEAVHLLSEVVNSQFFSLRGGINSWFEKV